jgi:TonB family protein
MRSKWTWMVLAGAAAAMLLGASAFAQTEPAGEGKRKVKSKVAPAYPDLARRMNIAGKVKIEVTISPDGRVKSSHAIGGHPVLVQACQEALKEWKFAAAPEESTQVIEFEFGGSNN